MRRGLVGIGAAQLCNKELHVLLVRNFFTVKESLLDLSADLSILLVWAAFNWLVLGEAFILRNFLGISSLARFVFVRVIGHRLVDKFLHNKYV